MEDRHYNLIFQGYWVRGEIEGFPAGSGIYLVYRCIYNKPTETSAGSVSLKELIYIGQSENGRERILNHDKEQTFLQACENGETLCYAFAPVEKSDLDIVENALIFAQQPRLNEQGKDHFNYSAAVFVLEGRCGLMEHLNFRIS